MDQSKKSITINLAILSLFLATFLLLIFSWDPLSSKQFFSSHKPTSNITSSTQKDELDIALDKASMANRTVIITIINKAYVEPHEEEYPTMLDLFLEGFWAGDETRPLVDNLLVVAMDETAHQRCLFRRLNCYKLATGSDDFAGEKLYMSEEFIEMMWRRTLFLLNVLKKGYNFIFTDTDVLWLRNPFSALSRNNTWDLQISTDVFNGIPTSENNLINTGFYYIQSNNKTISLFETWYDARTNSTGMKEQDVLLKLVRQGMLRKLGLNTKFLDTVYFSGFCKDSKDVNLVTTVHANCCRSIAAKVMDLKAVLRDWRGYKSKKLHLNHDQGVGDGLGIGNLTSNFQWSIHLSCFNSWHNNTSG